jgi:hypothetical protein
MKQLLTFCKWFVTENRGNALLLTSATALIATMGMFFFTALRDMSVKNKERTTHLYNATVMAMSIDTYIGTYLETLPYPKNSLLHNGEGQFSASELADITGIHDFDILSLSDLEKNGYIVSYNDPTALREGGHDKPYDKNATKIKIEFELDDVSKVIGIRYLVNLAGDVYEDNAPYSPGEPFFYIVSFSDDIDSGTYGDYNLTDNAITLTTGEGYAFDTILESNGEAPYAERTVILPGDNT